MVLNRAIKMRIYPDDEQRHKINVTQCSMQVFNLSCDFTESGESGFSTTYCGYPTFNISTVPHIRQGTSQEAINFVKMQPRSRINEAHEMEGVVARPLVELKDNQGKRVIVKIKVCDFT